ncbi:hypothetical protein [Sphingopyxis sp.]|uniref:hypothetical protein n=1 Tax=Sphingopyxis sp. TaxID=1908224 RepID=UPI0025DA2605|nr:hypothetical protein [Sphingopyxis sp.]
MFDRSTAATAATSSSENEGQGAKSVLSMGEVQSEIIERALPIAFATVAVNLSAM